MSSTYIRLINARTRKPEKVLALIARANQKKKDSVLADLTLEGETICVMTDKATETEAEQFIDALGPYLEVNSVITLETEFGIEGFRIIGPKQCSRLERVWRDQKDPNYSLDASGST